MKQAPKASVAVVLCSLMVAGMLPRICGAQETGNKTVGEWITRQE